MKKLLIASAIAVAVFGILFIVAGLYADRIIDPFVRSLLEQQKPLHHKIEYNKIKVDLIQGLIKIKDVRVYPDSSLNKDENIWMDIRVSLIKLTDFSIRDMLINKSLAIGDFNILQPDVIIYLPARPPEKIIEEVKEDRVERSKEQLLKSISLNRVLISGGSFRLIRNKVILASSPDINIVTEEISLIKNSTDDPIGYQYGNITLTLSNIELYSESGLYDMSLEHFQANKSDSTIILEGFRMIPKYDRKAFSKNLEYQNDRFDVKIGKIEIAGIGIEQMLAGRDLRIASVKLDSVDADIYRDKNVGFNFNRYPPFYNESFMKIGIPLLIDSVRVSNSRILYGELAESREAAGEILLSDFNLSMDNLTNKKLDSNSALEMRAYIAARVMGEGPLKAELVLPLEGNMHDFECTGSVGAMNLSPLNGMLEPSINMSFRAGRLNRLTFHFTANDNRSKGWMEFLYSDLDVVLLKKDPGKEWGFVSFLANSMTLSNNPAPGKDLKIVEIGYDRDKNKGIINYIWKTIQSGMVHTIMPIKKYQINRASNESKGENKKTKAK